MLAEKIAATSEGFSSSRSFLQQFGPIKVAKIEEVAVPEFEILREEIKEIRLMLQSSKTEASASSTNKKNEGLISPVLIYRKKLPEDILEEVCDKASRLSSVDKISITLNDKNMIVRVKPDRMGGWNQQEANDAVRSLMRDYLIKIPLP